MKHTVSLLLMVSIIFLFASCHREVEQISVTRVSMFEDKITMTQGEVHTLIAIVEPHEAYDKSVIWQSSKPNIASVKEGVVYAYNPAV